MLESKLCECLFYDIHFWNNNYYRSPLFYRKPPPEIFKYFEGMQKTKTKKHVLIHSKNPVLYLFTNNVISAITIGILRPIKYLATVFVSRLEPADPPIVTTC